MFILIFSSILAKILIALSEILAFLLLQNSHILTKVKSYKQLSDNAI
jgi:hypothetical protein